MSAGDKPFQERDNDILELPSLERCNALVDMYFDVCIATYRLLHRPTVEFWLTSLTENAQRNEALFHGA